MKDDIRARIMGYTPKMWLKPGAVPTIFKHKVFTMINMDGEIAAERASTLKRKEENARKEVSNQRF